jgi:hypothetical protein
MNNSRSRRDDFDLARDLERKRERARAVALNLDRARDRAGASGGRDLELARAVDRDVDRARASARAVDRALHHAAGLARDRALAGGGDRDGDTAIAIGLARDLAFDLDRDLTRARDRARDSATSIQLACNLAYDIARGGAFSRALSDALSDAFALAREVNSAYLASEAKSAVRGSRRVKGVARSADRLLAAATMVLPPVHRARYAGEFRSELWELANAGAGRPRQLAYACRQIV